MDIDIDVPFPEEIAAKDHDGQDNNGNDEAADHEGKAGRRAFRGIIRHGISLAEVDYWLRNEGKQGFVPCLGPRLLTRWQGRGR
jgi:hypothetical protein